MTPDPLPPSFWEGVDQFNQGEFYACHDTLEAIWMEAMEPEKSFYQGILQIAVAFYHLGNHNWRGAVILLGEGINRLRRHPSDFGGIDVDRLIEDATLALTTLQQAGPNQVVALASQWLPASHDETQERSPHIYRVISTQT